MRSRVFIGLSGGVDSAVSAALLQKAGHDVTGVFIKVWQPEWIECNWREDRKDAMRVAAHLGIPFVTLDLEKEYKEGVIDYMIKEYQAGRTPNPDVMCNREVKFGAFWHWAKTRGADFIATGHYARIGGEETSRTLLKSADPDKDQTYFLWTLGQDDLAHVLFPIGHMTKPAVRRLAKKFKLPNADKKDSQGLCFIGKIDVKSFLSHYIRTEKGNVLNPDGKIIGMHPGALLFTIGERHGFTVTEKTSRDMPYYVIAKDIVKNTITVSGKDPLKTSYNTDKNVPINNVNWVSGHTPDHGRDTGKTYPLSARNRYREPLKKVRLVGANHSEIIVEFEKPQDTITPGQSLVLYDGEACVGGGIIV